MTSTFLKSYKLPVAARLLKHAAYLGALAALMAACGGTSETQPSSGGATSSGGGGGGSSTGTSTGAGSSSGGTSGGSWDAGVVAVPLNGCALSAAYLVPTMIGASGPFALILDTGSQPIAVAKAGCTSCAAAGISTFYQPGTGATDLGQMLQEGYGGEPATEFGWSGESYQDVVSMGGLGGRVDFAAIESQANFLDPIVCDDESGALLSVPIQGVMGFGPDTILPSGTTSLLDQLTSAGMPDVFAVQLCHSGGTLWLGGSDPSVTTGPTVDALMSVESNGYDVDWTGVIVGPDNGGAIDGGIEINITDSNASGTLVDSGGTLIWVPPATFTAIGEALGKSTAVQNILGSSTWLTSKVVPGQTGNCITSSLTPQQIDAQLPTLTLQLSAAASAAAPIEVTLTATNSYLYYAKSKTGTVYCQNLVESTSAGFSDSFYLGYALMLNHVLVYDIANLRFGIAPAACAN